MIPRNGESVRINRVTNFDSGLSAIKKIVSPKFCAVVDDCVFFFVVAINEMNKSVAGEGARSRVRIRIRCE